MERAERNSKPARSKVNQSKACTVFQCANFAQDSQTRNALLLASPGPDITQQGRKIYTAGHNTFCAQVAVTVSGCTLVCAQVAITVSGCTLVPQYSNNTTELKT